MAIGGENDLVLRLLDASSRRAEVIASNIANQNTPGYTRRQLHFERLLRSAAGRGAALDSVEARVVEDRTTPARADGNNVTLELEMNALQENRLLYETYAAILDGHFEMLRAGIQGDR